MLPNLFFKSSVLIVQLNKIITILLYLNQEETLQEWSMGIQMFIMDLKKVIGHSFSSCIQISSVKCYSYDTTAIRNRDFSYG